MLMVKILFKFANKNSDNGNARIIHCKKGGTTMANLTSEELHALEDQLNAEQLLIKKFKTYASMTSDPQIKTTCEQVAAQHKVHYDTLMGHLF
jgi:pyrimidine operon attenuation protein/uracil phosphoribosyltransferase